MCRTAIPGLAWHRGQARLIGLVGSIGTPLAFGMFGMVSPGIGTSTAMPSAYFYRANFVLIRVILCAIADLSTCIFHVVFFSPTSILLLQSSLAKFDDFPKDPMASIRAIDSRNSSANISNQVVHNKILLGLSKRDCADLYSKLEFVELPVGTLLNEADEPINFAYFINSGLASVLSMKMDGRSVEVGLCGGEGFVGLPLIVGFKTSNTRVLMQVAGSAFRIKANDLLKALTGCPDLAISLAQFGQIMTLQSAQVAACNRLHEVEERLARWLLMSQDRLGGNLIPLTQEFLAHMLGTRRASVTVAAGILQKAGLISYVRGSLKVENRQSLEDAACECYEVIVKQTAKWQAEA